MSRYYDEKRLIPNNSGLRGTVVEVLPGRRAKVRVESRKNAVYTVKMHCPDEQLRVGVNCNLNQANRTNANKLVGTGVDSDFLCALCGGSVDMHCGQIQILEDQIAELQTLLGMASRFKDDDKTDLRSRVERLEAIFSISVGKDDVPSLGPHLDWRTDHCGPSCSCRAGHV